MNPADRELLERISATVEAGAPIRHETIRQWTKDAIRSIEIRNWLECSELAAQLADSVQRAIVAELVELNANPPAFRGGRPKQIYRERWKVGT